MCKLANHPARGAVTVVEVVSGISVSAPLMCMVGSDQVTVAPSRAKRSLLVPSWVPFTLLPVKVALQQLLPVNSNYNRQTNKQQKPQ